MACNLPKTISQWDILKWWISIKGKSFLISYLGFQTWLKLWHNSTELNDIFSALNTIFNKSIIFAWVRKNMVANYSHIRNFPLIKNSHMKQTPVWRQLIICKYFYQQLYWLFESIYSTSKGNIYKSIQRNKSRIIERKETLLQAIDFS